MKVKFSLIAFLMMFALAMQASTGLLSHAKAQIKSDGAKERAPRAAGPFAVIVELESESVAAHQRLSERIPRRGVDFEAPSARLYEAKLESEQADFKARAALVAPNLRVRAELHKLANAVSIEISESELGAIAALPGVKRLEVVRELHTMLNSSVPLINAPAVWDRLGGVGVAGQGVKIAILDTGIDITNPMFSDAGYAMPAGFPKTTPGSEALTNNKVIAAKSFVRSSADAKDQNGHGSNVAGIAAGSVTTSPLGNISGVAPMAYLGNYRVLGANGSGATDLIAQGIDQAVADGFDIISLSLGGDAGTGPDITVNSVEAAVASGRVVVVAAGNVGDGGEPVTITTPGIAPSAITVGATSNAHVVGPVVNVSGPGPIAAALTGIGSTKGTRPVVFDTGLGPLPYAYADPMGRGCDGILAGSLNGKVALIERGTCPFATKINNAAAAGASAVIIFNRDISEDTADSSGGGENLFTMDTTGTTIPSFFVVRSKGLALRDFALAHPDATISIASFGAGSFIPDVFADFSSRGPSILEGLKPDVSAPGEEIYSAAARTGDPIAGVVDPSGFASVSGTSQATPHIAGAAALIKQLNPSFTPEQIKSALISSASDVFTTPDKTSRVGVLDTGGGRVDLARASSISATFSPASLSFGIRKLKKNDVSASIDLKITSMVDGQNTFTIATQQLNPGDGVSVTTSGGGGISLARGQTGTATITINAIVGSQRRDYTGYVLVSGGSQTLHVPYWIKLVKKKV